MGAPLTGTQSPMNAIMDINGTQTYLGNSFTLAAAGKSLANTSEAPAIVVTNPAGSGKSLFVFTRAFTSNLNSVVFRTYLAPTLNVPGTPSVALNMRTGATQTSVSVCYQAASITSNGTLLDVYAGGLISIFATPLLVIDQGNSILITGQQNTAGTSLAYAQLAWYEI